MDSLNERQVRLDELMPLIQEQLGEGKRVKFMPRGTSMLPMLRQGYDSVILAPADKGIKPGDIALYKNKHGYILHRVIRLGKESYYFCGDNQAVLEEVSPDQILAVVTAYTKRGKLCQLTAPGYRLYRTIWVRWFCLRKYYIAVRRWLGRMRRGE